LNILNFKDSCCTINTISETTNIITGRGGLPFILRYIENIKFHKLIKDHVSKFSKSSKGVKPDCMLRQILAFFIDGTYKAISGFDSLKQDAGYAAALEIKRDSLVSSHSVKRFFKKFTFPKSAVFRMILNQLFIWRLKVEKPDSIVVDMDTVVLNNDDALTRHGVSPTYKNVKGFQPLQLTWNNMVIDAMFRRGSAHSNHGNDVIESMTRIVNLIRNNYSKDVPIILTCDSGFLDENNLHYFHTVLNILFVCNGKMYNSVKDYAGSVPDDAFAQFKSDTCTWNYLEFGSRLKSWNSIGFLRTIYTHLVCDEDGQYLLDFARPDSVLYTNIGVHKECSQALKDTTMASLVECEGIISLAHGRGKSELTNRSLKEFMVTEKLPFKRFGMNSAYYYLMLIGHFLMSSYNRDIVESEIIPINKSSRPQTIRRCLIDFAAQIVSTGNTIRLQVMKGVQKAMNLIRLWEYCCNPSIPHI